MRRNHVATTPTDDAKLMALLDEVLFNLQLLL